MIPYPMEWHYGPICADYCDHFTCDELKRQWMAIIQHRWRRLES